VKEFLSYHQRSENFTPQHIEQFYNWLHDRPNKITGGGLSAMMVHYFMYALKTFFNWLEETDQIKENPMNALRFRQPGGNTRQPLAQEEIKQLFEAATSQKEKAILHIFYSCGLRKSEGVVLDIGDISFKQKIIYVRKGKGLKRRAVPITEKVKQELEDYFLNERIEVKKPALPAGRHFDTEAFVLNHRGKRMSGASFNAVLKKLKGRAGITKEISLHHLRHSIATHLLENGLSVESVRDFLGHSQLETTQIYVKINQGQMKKLYGNTS
jgi:integrase/recombinase XerD